MQYANKVSFVYYIENNCNRNFHDFFNFFCSKRPSGILLSHLVGGVIINLINDMASSFLVTNYNYLYVYIFGIHNDSDRDIIYL